MREYEYQYRYERLQDVLSQELLDLSKNNVTVNNHIQAYLSGRFHETPQQMMVAMAVDLAKENASMKNQFIEHMNLTPLKTVIIPAGPIRNQQTPQ